MGPVEPGLVIVGAGECGTRAALALREAGYAGSVTLVGAERHHPYERPPLSKQLDGPGAAPVLKEIVSRDRLAACDITWIAPAEAVAIYRPARSVRLGDGRVLPYDGLLLATGASPRALPMAAQSRRTVALRTFDDAVAIRSVIRPGSHVALVGGGFVGLELAAAAREAGADVTVIEAQPRILARGVPAAIAAILHAEHQARGVRLLCGQTLTSVTDDADRVAIGLAGGERVVADLAVIGIGTLPNTALAEAAGLAVDNGIAVDERLRTSDDRIWAAGDCCSFPLALYGGRRVRLESWRNAQEQGALAALAMLGRATTLAAVPWFWSDQYDLGLQVAGLIDEGAETVARDLGANGLVLFHLAADGHLVAASAIGPGTAIARDVRLAERLIAEQACPPRIALASPAVRLKSLLGGARIRSDAA